MEVSRRLDDGVCPVCGRPLVYIDYSGSQQLSDGSSICRDCAGKLRVMFPLSSVRKNGNYSVSDPLKAETLDSVKEKLNHISEYTDSIRASYGFRNAVFKVESVEETKGGLFRPSSYSLRGRTLLGSFFPEDDVLLIKGGAETPLRLDEAGTFLPGGDGPLRRVNAGYPGILRISGKGLDMASGDIIVK